MAAKRKPPPPPQVGDIVIYRSRDGIDMAALITQFTDGFDWAHLRLFPPPTEKKDHLDPQWGTSRATDPAEPGRMTWRPRETP